MSSCRATNAKAMQLSGMSTIALDIDDLPEANMEVKIQGDVAIFRLVTAAEVAKAKEEGAAVITCDGVDMMPWDPEESGNA